MSGGQSISLSALATEALRALQKKHNIESLSKAVDQLIVSSGLLDSSQRNTLKEKTNPPGVGEPAANYSLCSKVGSTLYISGQVPVDKSGALVGKGDAEVQAEQCWKNILSIVRYYGGTEENVMKTTTYITNPMFRPLVSKPRDRLFAAPYPANTLVTVTALASPDFLVEIEAIAVVD